MARQSLEIRPVEDDAGLRTCFPLMRQLRPHLASAEAFLERVHRQRAAGYRLVARWQEMTPLALAGYRLQENLIHGVHLYVDDLVTDAARRGAGHGAALLDYLAREARAQGCSRLTLDTPLSNGLGQRFYFRCGLLATAFRFALELG